MTEDDEVDFVPKGRLDALTDGVFAFAMTLLVVKVDLPESFHAQSNAELTSELLDLSRTFIAYIVTFLVLASFWLARTRAKGDLEKASGAPVMTLSSVSGEGLDDVLRALAKLIGKARKPATREAQKRAWSP